MQVKMKVEEILAQLEAVRVAKGEAVFQQTRRDLARTVILQPNGEAFVQNAFPDMDVAELRKEAAAAQAPAFGDNPDRFMAELLRKQMPSIRTQMHFNTFVAALDALRITVDSYLKGDLEDAAKARAALNTALDMAKNIKGVVEQMEEIPSEARSPQARAATAEPTQFHEYDTQKALMVELANIATRANLDTWYGNSKPAFDGITDQKLRNELFDAIRAKRLELDAREAN